MTYRKSIFCISPAPEVAYDLHLSAALLRAAISNGRSEAALLRDSKNFESILHEDLNERWKDGFSLREIMKDKALLAPRSPKEKGERHMPISANLSLVTNYVRTTDKLWAVGERMALMVRRGAPSKDDYSQVMSDLVAEGDCWTKFVNFKLNEFVSKSDLSEEVKVRLKSHSQTPVCLEDIVCSEDEEMRKILYPFSRIFFTSLKQLVEWKSRLISSHSAALLDSFLRIHSFSEVRHLAYANHVLLEMVLSAEEVDYSESEIRSRFEVEKSKNLLSSDAYLTEEIENCASLLERARVFFNAFDEDYLLSSKLSSVRNIYQWFVQIRSGDPIYKKVKKRFRMDFNNGAQSRKIKNSSGLKNFKEFLEYIVKQRAVYKGLAGQFDQGYWAQKAGSYTAAPWKVRISPVGSLLFAGLACQGLPTCTFSDISDRMKDAGLVVTKAGKSQLYHNLKSLGLTIDSPDGVDAFLVSNPFKLNK